MMLGMRCDTRQLLDSYPSDLEFASLIDLGHERSREMTCALTTVSLTQRPSSVLPCLVSILLDGFETMLSPAKNQYKQLLI